MKRGYAGDIVPLLPAMLAGAAVDQGEGSAQPAEPHHTPVDPISSTSQPPIPSPPHPSPPPHSPLQSPPHSPPHSPHQSPPFSPPHFSPPRSYEAPLPEGNTSGSAEDSMQLKELMVLILEKALKRKTQKVVISESEGEEPDDQGRMIQEIDDDPLVSLVRESMKMKEKSTDFVTPTKASGDAQEEDISPTILEAAFKHCQKDCFFRGVSKGLQKDGKAPIVEGKSMKVAKQDSLDENEDWDAIKAKLEANAELTKDVLGKDLPDQDFAKRMVDMVNQRKKHFAEERAKAKRNKPMTQSHYKGEKVAKVKEEEQVKRTGKRKKQKARKGISVDKNAQGDSETDKEESVEAMNPTPLATKSNIAVLDLSVLIDTANFFLPNNSHLAETFHIHELYSGNVVLSANG
ncbi:hypothetical protein Tco_1522476 [Tanacetum coccineum]